MEREQILERLRPVDDLWNSQRTEAMLLAEVPAFSGWHGYGWREDPAGLVVSPLADNESDLTAIVKRIRTSLPEDIQVEGTLAGPFQEIGNGTPDELPKPLQPGNVVLVSGNCPPPCNVRNGTIGAFLIGKSTERVWLLSNRHVLADCTSDAQILGAGRIVLGTDLRQVAKDETNRVDAAVVKVDNPSGVNPAFSMLGRLRNPNPKVLAQLPRGASVSKLGNFSKLTSGKLILRCEKVNVSDCSGLAKEYQHQLAIVPDGKNGPFAGAGDSGSVIISDSGRFPIGLLFASSSNKPFFLANHWDTVIQELSAVVGEDLVLMLDNTMAVAG